MIIKVFANNGNDDIFRLGLNTKIATTYDQLDFVNNVLELILSDTVSLEKTANLAGRTIKHKLKNSVGSIPKDPG